MRCFSRRGKAYFPTACPEQYGPRGLVQMIKDDKGWKEKVFCSWISKKLCNSVKWQFRGLQILNWSMFRKHHLQQFISAMHWSLEIKGKEITTSCGLTQYSGSMLSPESLIGTRSATDVCFSSLVCFSMGLIMCVSQPQTQIGWWNPQKEMFQKASSSVTMALASCVLCVFCACVPWSEGEPGITAFSA